MRGRLVRTKLRHGCTGDGAHVRVVAHERRADLTNVRVGHVGTGKDSRVQAGEHVLSAAPRIVVESAESREIGRVASNKAPSVVEPP